LQSPPLAPGAIVVIRHERWRVGSATAFGAGTRVDVTRAGGQDRSVVTFLTPFDLVDRIRTRDRPRRVRRQHWRAALLGAQARAEHVDLPLSGLAAHIDLLPYQLEPLLALRSGQRRVLIADAVGLGKTIQAGLIMAELLRRREAARVLIAAPSHLCSQWRDELAARFALATRVADARTLADLAVTLPRAVNPWSTPAVWIGSLDFLKQPHVLDALAPEPWDLVVIDEAHMAVGQSERRAAASAITASSRRVLLLTATPFSGADDGRVLIQMGALSSDDTLAVFCRSRADVGIRARRRQRRLRILPSTAERHAFDLVDAFARAAVASATRATVDATQLLVSVLAKRALSTFAALALSVERRLAHLAGAAADAADVAQLSLDFGDGDDEALTVTIGMPVDRERSWMRRLQRAALAAARDGRKVDRLVTLLARSGEPAIVFTEFRDSLVAVAAALTRGRISIAIAHGALTPAELQRALDDFRGGRARVLVATDVASQGLNLHQCARWVVHADLPWNPIRLEQRAGRVDRLGQTRDVHVTQVVLAHARDVAFADRLAGRADAAARHTALVTDTRWRLRARAAAALLERRRRWRHAWRGPGVQSRPLAMTRGGADIYQHDIAGTETIVLGACGDRDHARRVQARARRVTRILATRARRARVIERALRSRLRATDAQPSLPGAIVADDARHTAQRAAALAAARAASDDRIAALDERASAHSSTVTSRRIFARSRP
jgi:superfamily II DNA or RNA helicase